MTVRKKRPQKKSAAKANHASPSSHKSQPAITRAMLWQATNSRYFERGEGYFDAGLVHALKQKDGKVYATVDGSHPYRTTLWVADGTVEGTCTCPLGQDHEFCKHLVATGLTWIESQVAAVGAVRQKRIEPDDIEAWLRKQSPDHLVETIMSQAMTDNEFYNVLKFRVAAEQPAVNITEMRAVLRQAMVIDDFVSWREASDYARGVDLVIDRLKAMADKHPTEVLELVEYALALWEEAIECIDSDGEMGMIMDDLLELHLDTCQRAKPNPEELAVRLFYKYINSGWDIFRGAYETYGRLFGKAGKAKYRELVEEEWRKLPRIKPGEKSDEQYGRAGKLKGLMQMFAEQDGDLDALVGIMSRDLSEPYSYLNIAERYRKARKHKEALKWAEQGVNAFPDHHDTQLHEFLADAYIRAKRSDDAMGVIWKTFQKRPGLERYKCLAGYAKKTGTWTAWREQALRHIRQDTKKRAKNSRPRQYRWATVPDHSLLVEIFLWESDVNAAWAEAQEGGCSESLWLRLAKAREKDHPEDAVVIYRRQVEPLLQQKTNHSYEEAIEYLDKTHKLMYGMGQETEFKQDLLAIKTEWKRLRNFIKYVERRKWGK